MTGTHGRARLAFAMLLAVATILVACGRRAANDPAPEEDVVEPALEALPPPDCERLAAAYVPCLPDAPSVVADRAVKPPEPWAALPCDRSAEGAVVTTVDLFTDGRSPGDLLLLRELADQEKARPGSLCLRLHAFTAEGMPGAVLDWFDRLRAEPAYSWEDLRDHLDGRRWLAAFHPQPEGPPAPPPPRLVEDLAAASVRGRGFGVRDPGLFLLDGRTVPIGLSFSAARARPASTDEAPPADRIPWSGKDLDPDAQRREFSMLCRTRQDWRHRLEVISGCLEKNPACPALLACISGRLYDQDWSESEVLDTPEDASKAMIRVGDGPVVLRAWLDPDCPHSRELYLTLLARARRDPRISLRAELVAGTPRGARVRELVLHPVVAGVPEGPACVLEEIFTHYRLLSDGELVRMPLGCGLDAPVLQGDPGTPKLPVGQLPPFCAANLTPCVLLGTHLLEGVPSQNYLEYAVSRTHREQEGHKP